MAHNEFLPLCDVLFNIISLASYFCDIVFDLVMGYALLERGRTAWFMVTFIFVALSLAVSQVVSLRWYLHTLAARRSDGARASGTTDPGRAGSSGTVVSTLVEKMARVGVVLIHLSQLGVLWRYFKLFLPVDLRYVKYEVRDLCMLRLVHAFVQAAPMLLVQLYLLVEDFTGGGESMSNSEPGDRQPAQVLAGGSSSQSSPPLPVSVTAAASGAADSREFRDLNVVSVSLSLFSVCWALASFSKNVRMHNVHKLVLTWLGVIFQLFWRLGTVSGRALCLVAYALLYEHWVLLVILLHWFSMFLWLVSPNNLFHRERLSRPRKATLCSLIAFVYVFAYINLQEANHRQKMVTFYSVMAVENSLLMYSWYSGMPGSGTSLPFVALTAFLTGLVFMFLYYRYFHVRRLKYEAGGRLNAPQLPLTLLTEIKEALQNSVQGPANGSVALPLSNGLSSVAHLLDSGGGDAPPPSLPPPPHQSLAQTVGGAVFSACLESGAGFQGASQRSSPGGGGSPPVLPDYSHQSQSQYKPATRYRYYGGGSHHHGGIPGVFNCRFTNPYCMTKRKKKKPTSFVPPPSVGPSVPFWCRPLANQLGDADCLARQPPPQPPPAFPPGLTSALGASPTPVDIQEKLREKKRQQLAELRVIEEEMLRGKLASQAQGDSSPQQHQSAHQYSPQILLAPHYLRACEDSSGLPYTLPRQTRYFRRTRLGRHLRPDHYVPPANSSDGDVDSGDDNDSECWHTSIPHLPFRLQQNRVRHETKL